MKKHIVTILAATFLLSACDMQSFPSPSKSQNQQAARPAPPLSSPIPNTPHYVTAQQGEYAYKPFGTNESELLMVRYLGEYNGQYRVMVNADKRVSFELTCEGNCMTVKMKNYMGQQFLTAETITDQKSVQYLIMKDAKSGLLTIYKD